MKQSVANILNFNGTPSQSFGIGSLLNIKPRYITESINAANNLHRRKANFTRFSTAPNLLTDRRLIMGQMVVTQNQFGSLHNGFRSSLPPIPSLRHQMHKSPELDFFSESEFSNTPPVAIEQTVEKKVEEEQIAESEDEQLKQNFIIESFSKIKLESDKINSEVTQKLQEAGTRITKLDQCWNQDGNNKEVQRQVLPQGGGQGQQQILLQRQNPVGSLNFEFEQSMFIKISDEIETNKQSIRTINAAIAVHSTLADQLSIEITEFGLDINSAKIRVENLNHQLDGGILGYINRFRNNTWFGDFIFKLGSYLSIGGAGLGIGAYLLGGGKVGGGVGMIAGLAVGYAGIRAVENRNEQIKDHLIKAKKKVKEDEGKLKEFKDENDKVKLFCADFKSNLARCEETNKTLTALNAKILEELESRAPDNQSCVDNMQKIESNDIPKSITSSTESAKLNTTVLEKPEISAPNYKSIINLGKDNMKKLEENKYEIAQAKNSLKEIEAQTVATDSKIDKIQADLEKLNQDIDKGLKMSRPGQPLGLKGWIVVGSGLGGGALGYYMSSTFLASGLGVAGGCIGALLLIKLCDFAKSAVDDYFKKKLGGLGPNFMPRV